MGRRKLARVLDLERGTTRLAGIKSIDSALDLNNGLTVANYETEVGKLVTSLGIYNTALSTVDDLYNSCIAQIDVLKDWNERMLNAIAGKYGTNSSEYEMAGAVRKSEFKRPTKKLK